MTISDQVERILVEVLDLDTAAMPLTAATPLAGHLPEFDSMAAVAILTALEDQFQIIIDDDEIDASIFENVGSVVAFVMRKTTT
ncbi:MAG: acyl carrier protein [Gammaproteobacteria bacterium]|nr:acyl carrier protein [Gammaproteobacteria bacterium]